VKSQNKGDIEGVLQVDRRIHHEPFMSMYNINVFLLLPVKTDYIRTFSFNLQGRSDSTGEHAGHWMRFDGIANSMNMNAVHVFKSVLVIIQNNQFHFMFALDQFMS
jgi:hypothetical protein